jgi:hypothetical protein
MSVPIINTTSPICNYKGGGIKPVNGILVFDSLAFELAIIWHYLINEIHFDCILLNTMTVLLILEELVTITVIIRFYLVGGSERW